MAHMSLSLVQVTPTALWPQKKSTLPVLSFAVRADHCEAVAAWGVAHAGCGLASVATTLMEMLVRRTRNICCYCSRCLKLSPWMESCEARELHWGSSEGGPAPAELWKPHIQRLDHSKFSPEHALKCCAQSGSVLHIRGVSGKTDPAAECVYHPEVPKEFLKTLDEMCGDDTNAVMSVELRQHETLELLLTVGATSFTIICMNLDGDFSIVDCICAGFLTTCDFQEALVAFDVYRAKDDALQS